MKIVIIGAGISGCTAYLSLRKYLPNPPAPALDHEYIIYEAHNTSNGVSTFKDLSNNSSYAATIVIGGGLGLGANGLSVLKRLDENLLKDITRGGYAYSHFNMKSKHGRVLMNRLATGSNPPMNSLGLHRHHLWKCLNERVPPGIIVNKRVSHVEVHTEGRNTVHFVDGSLPVDADLVIGADGLKSVVKNVMFLEAKGDEYAPRYEGLVSIGGFLSSADLKEHIEKGTMNLIFGGSGFFGYFYSESSKSDPNRDSPYHISEPGETVAWWSTYEIADCPPDPKHIDKEDMARQLRERHGGWSDPVVQKVINKVEVDSMYPTWTSPQLPTWERDGVVLLGDAAHTLPPTSGQGASQALEDVESFSLFLAHHLQQTYDNHDSPDDSNPSISAAEKQAIKIAAKRHMDI
jgi:2-polyprenyl-6-methoxyphenol hydroxylase-like FAD-dependent oxidoreductase